MKEKIILIIAIAFLVIVGGFVIYDKLDLDSAGKSYKERVMTIEEIERSQPTTFLSANGTYRKNFLGNKIKINCVITNKAKAATYKDAVVRVTYYAKTKTALRSNDYTIYEIFSPSSTKTVKLKIDNYKHVKTIGWDIISAEPY